MMQRRFSAFVNKSSSSSVTVDDDGSQVTMEKTDKASTIREEPIVLTPPSLKVKRVDYYYSRWSKTWKYRNMSSKVTVETVPVIQSAGNDLWKEFSFVIVRRVPREENLEPVFKIVIKSEYIIKACKDVIVTWPGVSWNTDPLELDPEMFLTFLREFAEYRDALAVKKVRSEYDTHVMNSVTLLLNCLANDYRTTIANIERMTSHGEISFDYLYAILVPRSIIVARCAVTGLPRLFKMTSFTRTSLDGKPVYQLVCESVDFVDRQLSQTVGVGRVQTTILISYFKGTTRISGLNAYPIRFHPDEAALRASSIRRGQKWVSLIGVHHKQFNGIAALKCGDRLLKHNVKGRVMVDRATFKRLNPNYQFPTPVPPKPVEIVNIGLFPPDPYQHANLGTAVVTNQGNRLFLSSRSSSSSDVSHPIIPHSPFPLQGSALVESQIGVQDDTSDVELTEEDLLISSTVVYGFSLSDKIWMELNVEKVEDVDWNQDAFANLVLPLGRKQLLQSLVEAHHREVGFDDFVKGKGHGLVINLFGPPGVGKTFSAEATSEHVQRPLYVVGAGDLGTRAAEMDGHLNRIFDVATEWKAIVLIDEADVFLEQRSLHDLERNAMVAVFLRHVEYYRGILFLTTNRVKAFDEAFLSRIHVALHFRELTEESKVQVWTAFIGKVGAADAITPDEIRALAKKDVNGRQIKNATRTAHSLALGRGEELGFIHFMETLEAMNDFTKEFERIRVENA